MRLIVSVIILITSLLSVVARANSSADPIRIPLRAVTITLDPGGIQDSQSLFVSRQVNCQLIRNQGSDFILEAAESIKYITPLKILLKINKNAKFHDGSPVTSKDVLSSFNYVKESRSVFRNLFDWVRSIDILDENTVIFALKKPIPQFLKVLSSNNYTIFKKSFLDEAKKKRELWKAPLGCGGYKVTTFDENKISLSPVEKGLPIIFYLNQANQVLASKINNYDIVSLNVIGSSGDLRNFKKIKIFDPAQYFLGISIKNPRWKNKNDRCDFLSNLNPKGIINSYNGYAVEAADLIPQGAIGYDPMSNYNDILDHGVVLKKNANKSNLKYKKFCLAYLTVSVQESNKNEYLKMIREQYPLATLKPVKNVKKFGRNFANDNCDAFVFALWSSYLDGYEYLTMFENNDANFSSVYDKNLINKILSSQDKASASKRAKEYREIVKDIGDYCVVKPLFTLPMKTVYVRNDLVTTGIGLGAISHYYLGNVARLRNV